MLYWLVMIFYYFCGVLSNYGSKVCKDGNKVG